MTNKQLISFGVAGSKFDTGWEAAMSTYATRTEKVVPTPLIFKDNIFSDEMKQAKNVLEVGAGIGRNLSSVMNLNDTVKYYAVEPNPSMRAFFWDMQDKTKYGDRVEIHADFSTLPKDIKFDVVLSIFVFQHLGYRSPSDDIMNVTDITREIMNFTTNDTIWMCFEHEGEEEGWQSRWMRECDILPHVYIKGYTGFSEMNDRGTNHNLIIWRKQR